VPPNASWAYRLPRKYIPHFIGSDFNAGERFLLTGLFADRSASLGSLLHGRSTLMLISPFISATSLPEMLKPNMYSAAKRSSFSFAIVSVVIEFPS
jgi:hypothetical protein